MTLDQLYVEIRAIAGKNPCAFTAYRDIEGKAYFDAWISHLGKSAYFDTPQELVYHMKKVQAAWEAQ